MKRLIIGLVSILGMLWATSSIADMVDKTVQVKLQVLQIIQLDVSQPDVVIPTADVGNNLKRPKSNNLRTEIII